MPTLENNADKKSSRRKLKKKDKFALQNNFNELP